MTLARISPAFLVIGAAVLETVIWIWTGILRYMNQGLSPNFLDLRQLGNSLAVMVLFVFLFSCYRLICRAECSRSHAWWLAVSAVVPLLSLALRPLLPAHDLDIALSVFGISQLLALGLVTALDSKDETHVVIRTLQHTLIIVIFIFSGTLAYGIFTPTDVPSTYRADAAVILGAAVWSHNRPSPLLRMRITKANDLLRTTIVPTIVCTGSNALGERPEAEVERTELLQLGVNPNAIIKESHTNSTLGQVLYLRDSLQSRGYRSFVIVSDHFHLRRALEMCRFNGLDVRGAASESLLPWLVISWYRIRDAAALLAYWAIGT